MRLAFLIRAGLALAACSAGNPAAAQCQPVFEHFPLDYIVAGSGVVRDIALWDPDGPGPQTELVVAVGQFDSLGGGTSANLAVYDPANGSWNNPLPSLPGKSLSRVAAGAQGQLAVSAVPNTIGFTPETIYTWNGLEWIALPEIKSGSLYGGPSTLEYDATGGLYCLGFLELGSLLTLTARWDGVQWTELGNGLPALAGRLHVAPDGIVYASGSKSQIDYGVVAAPLAVWNGSEWFEVAAGTQVQASTINDFAFLSNGAIAAGGFFTDTTTQQQSVFAVWTGGDWLIPPGSPSFDPSISPVQVEVLATAEVLFGGAMVGADGAQQEYLAKWDGETLSTFASAANGGAGDLADLAVAADGVVWAGGRWTMGPGANIDSGLSRTALPCSASTETLGSAGQGSAGPLTLTGQLNPWLGGAFTAQLTGLAPGALPYTLIGAQLGTTPLALLVPDADSGSNLYFTPNFALSEFLVNNQGTATFSTLLPNNPALAGLSIGMQIASIELDSFGIPTLIATSNALLLNFGSY